VQRRLAAAAAAVVLALLLGGPARLEARGLELRPVLLDPADPGRTRLGALEFRGGLELSDDQAPDFGGLSALALLDQGRQLVALSDRGRVITAHLGYDARGWLVSAGELQIAPLLDVDGQPVQGRRSDAESLAALPDGSWVVGFERRHRLMRYPPGLGRADARPLELAPPPGLEQAPANGGIEALTVLPDGRLLALEEGADDGSTDHRAWLGGGRFGWSRASYRTLPHFRPTDAAALADGTVLVLERRFSWLGGFATRLLAVPAGAWERPGPVSGSELARIEPPLTEDNFEGLAARPGAPGEILITLVSDDNFNLLQRTLLLQFSWKR